jgi:hypothetical protein
MDKTTEELLNICEKLQLSARINGRTGSIHLYEDLGDFECAEQAILFLTERFKEMEKDENNERNSS